MPDSDKTEELKVAAAKRFIAGATLSGLDANGRTRKNPRRRLIAAVVLVVALALAEWLGVTPEPVQAALQAIADGVCASVAACD